jgi:hypothetical protein
MASTRRRCRSAGGTPALRRRCAKPANAALPSMSITLEVNTMDLTTLITACALTVDPKLMHALIWRQSGGEPWMFSVSGERQPQVLRSMEEAIGAARSTRPGEIAIRVGLTGLPGTPRSVTATMFTPCSNIASAARQIAQFFELCRASSRSKGDPIHCAVAAFHGSWERPDNGFADVVQATSPKATRPISRCQTGQESRQPTAAPRGGPQRGRQRRHRLRRPRRTILNAPARALSFRSCHDRPTRIR